MVAGKNHLQTDAQLTQITNALNSLRPFLRLKKRGQQKRCEYPDDSDNNHYLNHGQTLLIMLLDGHGWFAGEVAL